MKNDNGTLDFSSIIASSVHDMKNSLAMVINSIEEISESLQPQDEDGEESIARLKYESKRLNNHLVQLLTLYKMDKDQYYMNIADTNLAEFIHETTLPHRELLEPRGVQFQFDIDEHMIWYFDPTLVAGVINNIVNNAYKYTRDKIRISAQVENKWLVIRLADNGGGYPAEMLEKGLGGRSGISFETGSTGLGLYFSHQVAQMHTHRDKQGYIRLDNDGIDGGGRFCLYLP